MPLTTPSLDDRTYRELLEDALARIPVHNPEWTNFNDSDPGVTLVQVFSFLTESVLYRANQIPERNRRRFLQLLGVPLRAASSAQGMVTFTREKGAPETLTLPGELELKAQSTPFLTRAGLDVLPIETAVFYKRAIENPDPSLTAYYTQLHASFLGSPTAGGLVLYETVALPAPMNGTAATGVDLGTDTVDGSLWIALLLRKADAPRTVADLPAKLAEVRSALAGRTMSLGIIPDMAAAGAMAEPGAVSTAGEALLQYQIPAAPPRSSDGLPRPMSLSGDRLPSYTSLPARTTTNVLAGPGIVEIDLPLADAMRLWENLEPLEAGAGDFPPALDDTTLEQRVITWLRIRLPEQEIGTSPARRHKPRIRWVCINATMVDQRVRVRGEHLATATGEPGQTYFLARVPVVPGSVVITTTRGGGEPRRWTETDDLLAAPAEGPDDDLLVPGQAGATGNPRAHVFTVDAESGAVRFGDGLHGRRPPFGAVLSADYDAGMGRAGNVGIGAISSGTTFPNAMKVSNPIPTWGGDAGETVADGERQISRYLQHRDRLVTQEDFTTIARRTPGVDIGRVEVLPAFNPVLSPNEPGDAPGAVTILAIPKFDPYHPNEPEPDQFFLDCICAYLAPRRLVTTELHIRGPRYVPLWVSVGFEPVPGESFSEVREAVKQAIRVFLAPLPDPADPRHGGWPLRKPVIGLELWAIAARVPGVSLVSSVLLATASGAPVPSVPIVGLELPKLLGVEAQAGEPVSIESMRSQVVTQDPSLKLVAVPVIPEECR